MPECAYGGTVTFDSNMLLEKKLQLIEQFPLLLSQHLSYKGSREYYLCVAKEYHKVDGEDDLEAPHLHFILYSNTLLPNYRVNAIRECIKYMYGRSQFYMMTTLKTRSYSEYIKKDSDRLLVLTNQSHYYEMNLEEPMDDIDYGYFEDINDDL